VFFNVPGCVSIAGLHEQQLLAAAMVPGMVLQRIEHAAQNFPARAVLDSAMQAIHQGDQLLVVLVELFNAHAQILCP